MTSAVTVSLGAAATARRLFEPIYRLYYETFSKPPYQWPEGEEEQYRRRFERLMGDPTFGIAVAQCGDELAGFAYGYTLRPGTKWWEGFVTPVPPEVTTEWEGRTFALIDFAVDESVRGKGVGRRLHDTLLGSRHEERATLAVEPQAHEARGIYEHWGWQVVGRLRGPATDFAPEFDIMVLLLSLKAQAVSLGGRRGAVHAVAAPLLSAARVTTAQLPTGAVHAIGLSDSGLREPPPWAASPQRDLRHRPYGEAGPGGETPHPQGCGGKRPRRPRWPVQRSPQGVGMAVPAQRPLRRNPRQPRGRERLTSADIASLIESFQPGTSKRELAQRYGISESTVKRLLHARGARGEDKRFA